MAPLAEAPVAEVPQRSRRSRVAAPLLVAGGVAVASLALHLRDPHDSGSWGYCPWKLLTGFDCPGCGVLRAVNDLTHGDVVAAASSNLLFVLALPVMAVLWGRWLRRSWRGESAGSVPPGRARAIWVAAVVVTVTFTVVRNTPWGSWLHS